jgi:hypothetical protein
MGEKGLKEEDWTGRSKWAQEDVETLYSVLNRLVRVRVRVSCDREDPVST